MPFEGVPMPAGPKPEDVRKNREESLLLLKGEQVHGAGRSPLTPEQVHDITILLNDLNSDFNDPVLGFIPAGALRDLHTTFNLPSDQRDEGERRFKEAFKEAMQAYNAS